MKKLLCFLFLSCILLTPGIGRSEDSDSFVKTREPVGENQIGRFHIITNSIGFTYVLDTKEGYAWRNIAKNNEFKRMIFDNKYQSALEAVKAYSSRSKAEILIDESGKVIDLFGLPDKN